MAVVIPSSRSLAMSSNEPPSPRTPPHAGQSGGEDGQEMSKVSVGNSYPDAASTTVDKDFASKHLCKPEGFVVTKEMREEVLKIRNAGKVESSMYQPAAAALTLLSEAIYGKLSKKQQELHRKRHQLPERAPGHLVFIDHHKCAPTHFPNEALCSVTDAPDLVGVYDVKKYASKDGVYKGVPHHHIEAIVEAKPAGGGGGRAQAASYAYRHHQARPDHPMVYCLVIKPQWYQVILSSPSGVDASPETPWDDLSLLAAYIHSHYYPPRDHCIVDESITSSPGPTPDALPFWNVNIAGKLYTEGVFLFIGVPWGRRTTVFLIKDEKGKLVVLKETYFDGRRRWKEEDILTHIHRDGDVPGVVRLKKVENAISGRRAVQCGSVEERTLRIKKRLVFYDRGIRLTKAESVNEVLEAIYDTLEVHRMLLSQRKVLHRDMSIFNILLRPTWGETGKPVFPGTPPFIRDVLAGEARPLKERFPTCLTIDVDNAALLEQASCDRVSADELTHRTGTPMFVARGVSAGKAIRNVVTMSGVRMPELTDEALELYAKVHGKARYNRYKEPDRHSRHGGYPLTLDEAEHQPPPKYYHRAEHDAESIFWTMLVALLRLKPLGKPSQTYADGALLAIWNALHSHGIPDVPQVTMHSETRMYVFTLDEETWKACFLPEMADVADLLYRIAKHVGPEYAYWEGELVEDHLHEAMQRLILQYLVEHRDHPIAVDPADLRPTRAPPEGNKMAIISPSFNMRNTAEGTQSAQKLGITGSFSLNPANLPSVPVVASSSKRQSESHGGQGSKRRKGVSGSAVQSREADSEE